MSWRAVGRPHPVFQAATALELIGPHTTPLTGVECVVQLASLNGVVCGWDEHRGLKGYDPAGSMSPARHR